MEGYSSATNSTRRKLKRPGHWVWGSPAPVWQRHSCTISADRAVLRVGMAGKRRRHGLFASSATGNCQYLLAVRQVSVRSIFSWWKYLASSAQGRLLQEPLETSEQHVPSASPVSTVLYDGIWWGPHLCSCLRTCIWRTVSDVWRLEENLKKEASVSVFTGCVDISLFYFSCETDTCQKFHSVVLQNPTNSLPCVLAPDRYAVVPSCRSSWSLSG